MQKSLFCRYFAHQAIMSHLSLDYNPSGISFADIIVSGPLLSNITFGIQSLSNFGQTSRLITSALLAFLTRVFTTPTNLCLVISTKYITGELLLSRARLFFRYGLSVSLMSFLLVFFSLRATAVFTGYLIYASCLRFNSGL